MAWTDVIARALRPFVQPTVDERIHLGMKRFAAEIAEGDTARSLESYTPLAGQGLENPESVVSKKGWPYILDMEKNNGTLNGFMRTRELSVTQTGWQIVEGEDSDAGKEVANFVRESIDSLPGSFDADLGKIFAAWRYGYSINELVWGPWTAPGSSAERWNVIAIKDKPCWTFKFDVDEFGNIRSLLQELNGEKKELDPAKFIIGQFNHTGWNPYGRGLLQQCFIHDWFMRKGWEFWAEHIERYASPVLVGKHPSTVKGKTLSAFQSAVAALRSRGSITINEDLAVDYLTAASQGRDAYREFSDEQRLNIAFIVTGSELAAMVGDSGSRALGQVHRKVADTILQSDMKRLFGIVNEQYVRRIVVANFGNVPMPLLVPEAEDDTTREVASKIALDWHARGVPVSIEWIRRKFDIEVPADDEEVLASPTQVQGVEPSRGGLGDDGDEPVGFATAEEREERLPANVIRRRATERLIDRESTALIDAAVEAGALAVDGVRRSMLSQGRAVWAADNLDENGRPSRRPLGNETRFDLGDFRTITERAIVGGKALGLRSGFEELSKLGVAWPDDGETSFADLPEPNAAYEALDARVPVTAAEWALMADEARYTAFTVTESVGADMVRFYKQSLLTAIENSWSMDQWVAYVNDEMRGWTDVILGTAPGAQTEARLRSIYRTNVMQATNDGRTAMFERPSSDPVALYYYNSILDERTTALCNGLHGRIATMEEWRARNLVPPNHYQCRSFLTPILRSQVDRIPADLIDRKLPASLQPAKGFG